MARKTDVLKVIDQKSKATGAPLPLIQEDQPAPPAFYVIPAPDTLVELSQAIQRSTQAPLVMVAIGWQEAPNIAPDYYNVEYSTSSDFTDAQKRRANTTSATIDGLKANGVTYYFRVQAVLGGIYSAFSETLAVVTMNDTTPPPEVTGAAASFQNSDLIITYTIPASEIIKDVEIQIWNFAHTIHYGTFYPTTNRFVWTAEDNIAATGGSPLTQVSIDIHTRSWTNQLSLTGVNITATAPIPSTPTGYTSNWIGDTGTADEDFITSWLGAANANDYELTIDGKLYYTRDVKFVYNYEQNIIDHLPTLASGDPSFVWLLKARDKLGQVSIPVNVTVTNAAPPSGVMTVNTISGFSQLTVTVALLGGTIIQDFSHFEYALASGSTTLQTINSSDTMIHFQLSESGTYNVNVRAVDKFNQKSPPVTISGVIMDVLTIEQLRAETKYRDSTGASSPALDFLKDSIGSGGTSKVYGAVGAGVWQWIEASRPFIDRHKVVTFTGGYISAVPAYLSFDDGTTITYYAGPVSVGTSGEKILTKYTSEATARTNAFDLQAFALSRIDLPNLQEARTIRIYFNNTAGALTVYEYYPRRLVQTDDLEAENARAINAVVGTLVADKLSALVSKIGQLTIDATGWLFQGTGTGASPTTGLKIFNSGGIGKLSTYNTGVEQITLDTDGKLKWGAGAGVMDFDGIFINAATAVDDKRSYGFKGASNVLGGIYAIEGGGTLDQVIVFKKSNTGRDSTVMFDVRAPSTRPASIDSFMSSGVSTSRPFYASITSGGSIVTELDAQGSTGVITLRSPVVTTFTLKVTGDSAGGITAGSTTAPTANLDVYRGSATNGSAVIRGTTNNSHFNFSTAEDTYIRGGKSTSHVILNDNAANVGVGTSSPTAKLDVINGYMRARDNGTNNAPTSGDGLELAAISNIAYVQSYNRDSSTWQELQVSGSPLRFNANGSEAAAFGAAGNLGLVNKLYIGGTGTVPSYQIHLSTDSAGKPTTSTWSVISDSRSKKNVADMTGALERLKRIKVKEFDFNGKFGTDKDRHSSGVVAEDIQQIYPNSVQVIEVEDDNGKIESVLTVNYHELFIDYAVAIQELEAKVAALEAKQT